MAPPAWGQTTPQTDATKVPAAKPAAAARASSSASSLEASPPVVTAPTGSPNLEVPEGQRPVLTLEQALAAVQERNPDLRAARAQLQAARQGVLKAWSAYLPQASVGGTYTRNSVPAILPFPNFGAGFNIVTMPNGTVTAVPKEIDNIAVQKKNQYGAQVQVSQPILLGSAIPGIMGAYTGEDIAELTTDEIQREMLFATAELFYGAVGARQALGVAKQQVKLRQDHLDSAEAAYKAGTVAELAVLRARIDLGNAQQNETRAKNGYAAVRSSLATIIGRDNIDFDVPSADLEALAAKAKATPREPEESAQVTTALHQRPDLKAANLGIEVQHRAKQAVWAQFLPVIAANWDLRYSSVKSFTNKNWVWALMVTASVPILTGGLRYAELKEASANIDKAEAQAQSLRDKISDQVRRSRLDLASAWANRHKAAEQVELARANWKAVEKAFDVGASSPLDVADAANELQGAELSLVQETVGVWVAELHLQKALGSEHPGPAPAALESSAH